MTNTYTPIASVTLSATASEVVFSGLPQSFRDLIVVASALTNGGSNNVAVVRVNGDTGSNYSRVQMIGDGSITPTFAGSGENAFYGSYFGTSTAPSSCVYQFMDYSQTNKHKTVLMRTDIDTRTMASANRWGNIAAISSISLAPNSGSFTSGSTFTVFGVIA
jgi:hypothetical protein